VDLDGILCECVGWIQLAQGRVQKQVLVNSERNLHVP
jgi:hypothetical protein